MNNKIQDFFSSIPEEVLEVCLQEIFESEETGFIKENALFRVYMKKLNEITEGMTPNDILMCSVGIMKEASKRWLDLIKEK